MQRAFDIFVWIVVGMGLAMIIYMGFQIRESLQLREQYRLERQEDMFRRAQKHIFVGKPGKRPFMVFREQYGKLEVHCPQRKIWIKI